jgi:branched-chain amino acid transport system ATP-binding protein
MADTPLLVVDDLAYAYSGVAAVRGVSLEVRPAEIVALLGSNGAGKSTTVKAIAGALRPERGRVTFKGEPIAGEPCHVVVRRGITLVPEGRLVFPQMTVLDNLHMGGHALGSAAESARNIERVCAIFPRLAERRGQLAGSMSGGEQQMLAIARGMMSSPALMILDEPSLGLMPILVQELFRVIQRVNGEGVSILLVEQNVHQSLRVAHRGYVMEKGQIVLSGSGQELLGNEFVRRAFLGH